MRAIALLIMLAGCATAPKPCPPSIPKVETVEVTRMVQVPCAVTEPVKPAPPKLPPGVVGWNQLKSDALIALLLQKLGEWSAPGGYGERASQAIRECKKVSEAQ